MTKQDYRCDDGGLDTVFGALDRKSLRERDQTHFRSRVVRLTKVTVQTSGGRCIYNSAEFLLPEDGPSGLRARVSTLEVDRLNLVPFRIGHVLETERQDTALVRCRMSGIFYLYPLSLRIPALLTRIVIPPNASKADLITAAPSVTDDVFTTAFPPTIHHKSQLHVSLPVQVGSTSELRKQLTLRDLVHNLLRGSRIEVIYDYICSPRGE